MIFMIFMNSNEQLSQLQQISANIAHIQNLITIIKQCELMNYIIFKKLCKKAKIEIVKIILLQVNVESLQLMFN